MSQLTKVTEGNGGADFQLYRMTPYRLVGGGKAKHYGSSKGVKDGRGRKRRNDNAIKTQRLDTMANRVCHTRKPFRQNGTGARV